MFVSIDSDLEIRLSELPNPKTTEEAARAPYKVIAPLKATVGTMNYEVPADIDVSRYQSIVIGCEITRNAGDDRRPAAAVVDISQDPQVEAATRR